MRLSSLEIRLLIGYTGVVTGTCFLLLAVGFAIYEVSFLARSFEAQGQVIANVQSRIQNADPHSGMYLSKRAFVHNFGMTVDMGRHRPSSVQLVLLRRATRWAKRSSYSI